MNCKRKNGEKRKKRSVEKNKFRSLLCNLLLFLVLCTLAFIFPFLQNDSLLIEIYVIQALSMMMFIYLRRKCVAFDAMFTAKLIVEAVMYVNLVESVAVGERPTR